MRPAPLSDLDPAYGERSTDARHLALLRKSVLAVLHGLQASEVHSPRKILWLAYHPRIESRAPAGFRHVAAGAQSNRALRRLNAHVERLTRTFAITAPDGLAAGAVIAFAAARDADVSVAADAERMFHRLVSLDPVRGNYYRARVERLRAALAL